MDLEILDENIKIYNEIKSFIVYEYEYMVAFKHNGSFIVWNLRKKFKGKSKNIKGHSHIESFQMAKLMCKNIVNKKYPKSRLLYILKAYVRCSTDLKYINKIEELIATRKQKGKKSGYRNRLHIAQ